MTDEIKVQDAGTADKVKLAVAILIVIAGVAGYYLLAGRAAWLRCVRNTIKASSSIPSRTTSNALSANSPSSSK